MLAVIMNQKMRTRPRAMTALRIMTMAAESSRRACIVSLMAMRVKLRGTRRAARIWLPTRDPAIRSHTFEILDKTAIPRAILALHGKQLTLLQSPKMVGGKAGRRVARGHWPFARALTSTCPHAAAQTNIHKLRHHGFRRLAFFANRHRFLFRLRAPIGPEETRRVERWLPTARMFLAPSALLATWLDPTELTSNSTVPWWLLRLYIAHSVVVMLLVRWRRESTPAFRVLVHAADILWPALISLYAPGQRSPFFLFFVFVL